MTDNLPEDVVVNILARLLIKEIVKCRSVCKSWYSLISTKNFQSYHLKRSAAANPSLVLFRHGIDKKERTEHYSLCLLDDDDDHAFPRTRIQEFDSPFKSVIREYPALRIVGCCNGVVCFTDDHYHFIHRAAFWNPCIRKLVEIPPPPAVSRTFKPYGDTVGFGYDAVNDDYKLVRVSVDPLECQLIEIYSWRSGVWRMVDHQLNCLIRYRSSSVHINGVCYWLASRRKPGYSNMIISFGLTTEVFGEMPPVPDDLVEGSNVALVASSCKGLLSLVLLDNDPITNKDCATIWVMRKGSWIKVVVWESSYVIYKLLAFKDNDDGVALFTAAVDLFDSDEYLIRYDLNKREKTELMVVRRAGILHLIVNYVESLALL